MIWTARDIEIGRKKMCLRLPVRVYEASEHGQNFKEWVEYRVGRGTIESISDKKIHTVRLVQRQINTCYT